MMRRTPCAAMLAGIALTLAACGGGTETADTAGRSTSATSPASDGQASGETVVQIDDFAFDPETTTVETGTTVTWSNEDPTSHTVTAGDEDQPDPDAFDLVVDEQGQAVSFTFDESGSHAYFCELHPFMSGTVQVTG